jgi:hypothetical protein
LYVNSLLLVYRPNTLGIPSAIGVRAADQLFSNDGCLSSSDGGLRVPVVLPNFLVVHRLTLRCRDGQLLPKGGELGNKRYMIRVTAVVRDPRPQDLAS